MMADFVENNGYNLSLKMEIEANELESNQDEWVQVLFVFCS